MDKEKQTIRTILEAFREAGHKLPDFFESDAELFHFNGHPLLFTTDEFSEEDLFRDNHPFVLGWNLAAATISDILACGGIPVYYSHSMTVSQGRDERYIHRLATGIATCVKQSGASFLGGDLGFSEKWRYTGIAIGKAGKMLTRRGAVPGDPIYMTGTVGSGNLEAALKLYSGNILLKPLLNRIKVQFPLRMNESAFITPYASCCIDSSDGVFRAVTALCELTGTGFRIEALPFRKEALQACTLLGKPQELLFLGECGEYELVFTVPAGKEEEMKHKASQSGIGITRIGVVTGTPGYSLELKDRPVDLSGYSIYARDFPDVKDYLAAIIQFLKDET